jgi:hypothetical protein
LFQSNCQCLTKPLALFESEHSRGFRSQLMM